MRVEEKKGVKEGKGRVFNRTPKIRYLVIRVCHWILC